MRHIVLIVAILVALPVSEAATKACHERCICSEDTMNCNTALLLSPPVGYWPDVLYLEMEGNLITKLYDYSFSGFPNVLLLDLSVNLLTTFDASWFASLPLKGLSVALNLIKTFTAPQDVILKGLLVLNVAANRIAELDPELMQRIAPDLLMLSLDCNKLKLAADKSVLNHSNLKILGLSQNDASEISSATLKGVPSIEILSVLNSSITDITGVFVEMTKLKILGLEMNNITHVQAGSFPSTRTLDMLQLESSLVERLDVSAVSSAMSGGRGSILDITSTPLACSCQYESVYWWAEGRGVNLEARCPGANCQFARHTNFSAPRGFNNEDSSRWGRPERFAAMSLVLLNGQISKDHGLSDERTERFLTLFRLFSERNSGDTFSRESCFIGTGDADVDRY